MTSKETLINIIMKASDETCDNVLNKLLVRFGLANDEEPETFIVANSREFVESEHPRDKIGRFAPGGSSRGEMYEREVVKWDKIGHSSPINKKIRELKAKLSKEKRTRENEIMEDGSKRAIEIESNIARLQRQIAEETREEKRRQRLEVESKAGAHIMKKKVKEYRDIDEEIDYIEEKFADRNLSSPTHGEVVFPKTKSGQKAQAKYEKLKARLAELDDEIEWDMVDDDK